MATPTTLSSVLKACALLLGVTAAMAQPPQPPPEPPEEPSVKQGICGGIQGLECPRSDQYCELPAGQCSGADLQGICLARPDACTKEFAPVCGCDGETYGNDCERKKAGVQKNHDGECATASPNGQR